MGFKCPVCSQDFGVDRVAWNRHLRLEHRGLGADVLRVTRKMAEGAEERQDDHKERRGTDDGSN